jgi:hypothetical protein
VNKTLLSALQGLNSPLDQVFSTGRQDLQPDIVGNSTGRLDQTACKVEIGLRSGREGNFNLLVANFNQLIKVSPFLIAAL